MMSIRLFNLSDYEMLSSWWKQHEWPSIPLSFLPKIGIIVGDCVAGFIYSTDSKICWLEFIISDPKCEQKKRQDALNLLIQEASNTAKDLGYEVIFTSVSHKGLIEKYKNNGFKVTDNNMTNLMRFI